MELNIHSILYLCLHRPVLILPGSKLKGGKLLGSGFVTNLRGVSQKAWVEPRRPDGTTSCIEAEFVQPIFNKITDLTNDQCFAIAQLVTGNMVQTLSRVDRQNDAVSRVEIFCDETSERIEVRPNCISWMEYNKGKWEELPIHNYGQVMLYLIKIGIWPFGLEWFEKQIIRLPIK